MLPENNVTTPVHKGLNTQKHPGRILVIDDEPVICDMLQVILEEDFSILCAYNVIDGLSLARAEQPDLILLDISMPEVDGYEICRILKADAETKGIPIIFITSKTSAQDETKGLEAGSVDYIAKPINPSIVKARVGIHMELKKQRDYLQELSTLDALTGMPNRRWLNHCLEDELRRSRRTEANLSVCLIDIDCFKAYNDNYGHVEGDDCLRAVAENLQHVPCRGGDLVARYGGEEFVAILPNTPFESLLFMAEKFRLTIEQAAIPHIYSSVADIVTVSVGATTVTPDIQLTTNGLLQKADRLLYKAKNDGRNRVCALESE